MSQDPVQSASVHLYGHTDPSLLLAQEDLYEFFLAIVQDWAPSRVMDHLRSLLVHHNSSASLPSTQALQTLLKSNDQALFFQTLRRCSYIIINNWDPISNKRPYIKDLVALFQDPKLNRPASNHLDHRLNFWLQRFVKTDIYQGLTRIAQRIEQREIRKTHWSDRYSYYSSMAQINDPSSSPEEREAAQVYTAKMRSQFRLNLALYVAHSQQDIQGKKTPHQDLNPDRPHLDQFRSVSQGTSENPTGLGLSTIQLIKTLVLKQGIFNQKNLAEIFKGQVSGLPYHAYKKSLINYLFFSRSTQDNIQKLRHLLDQEITSLYPNQNQTVLNDNLIIRTNLKIIDVLTIDGGKVPSHLFIRLTAQGHLLVLATFLLKLVLIAPQSRAYLDNKLATLFLFYQAQSPEESEWFGHFLDMINVALSIYTDGVSYNLLQTENPSPASRSQATSRPKTIDRPSDSALENYRIFSQVNSPLLSRGSQKPKSSTPSTTPPPPQNPAPSNVIIRYDAVTGEPIAFPLKTLPWEDRPSAP